MTGVRPLVLEATALRTLPTESQTTSQTTDVELVKGTL